MKINDINDKTTTSVSDTSGFAISNPYSMVALSLSIQELLTHLQQETLNLQTTLNSKDGSSSGTSTAQTTSSTTASTSPYGDVSSWTVACVVAGLAEDNNQLQDMLAKNELTLTENQNNILTGKVQESQDNFGKWMKDYEDKKYADSHKSRWEKFCNVFKSAFNEIVKVIDKYDPIILLEDKIETAIEDKLGIAHQHLFKLETQIGLVKEGLNDVNTGITKGLDIAAKAMGKFFADTCKFGGDEEKWEKAFEVILPVAAVASAILTAGVTSALSATEVTVVAGEEALEAGVQTASVTEKAVGAVKQALSFLKNLSRSQSAGLFMFTNRLQNNGFTQNLAKACYPNDVAKQESIEMALNTTLSLVGMMAGCNCASSFLPKESEFFTSNLYKWMQRAQYIETASTAVGSIGVGKCDIDLAKFEGELGDLDSAMTMNSTYTEMTEQLIQQSQTTMSSLMTSIGENITSLAQAMPKEMAASASAV